MPRRTGGTGWLSPTTAARTPQSSPAFTEPVETLPMGSRRERGTRDTGWAEHPVQPGLGFAPLSFPAPNTGGTTGFFSKGELAAAPQRDDSIFCAAGCARQKAGRFPAERSVALRLLPSFRAGTLRRGRGLGRFLRGTSERTKTRQHSRNDVPCSEGSSHLNLQCFDTCFFKKNP